MADIRINALTTTATSSASDDFIAIDGSANGTRKLSIFTPNFGGNLTVSGSTTNSTFAKALIVSGGYSDGPAAGQGMFTGATTSGAVVCGTGSTNDVELWNKNGTKVLSIATGTTTTTLAGNLTVSGTASVGATSGLVDSLLYLDRSTTARTSQLQFRTAGVADWQVYTAGATSPLGFYANGADRMALTQTGNLLLGTTTDSGQKLQVSGTASISGAISIGNTVTSAASVASTHKVTISIGGVTYYLLASNV